MKSVLVFTAGTALGIGLTASIGSQQGQTVRDFPDLGKGLMETSGCLGVESFQVKSGKQVVIAAWFENRKAMERWYFSDMHQGAMKKFFPTMGQGKKPFAAFKDETSPMLVIASVTPGSKPIGNGSQLAVDQIAIEGYAPIPGGVAFGGTFSPASLKVPGLVRIPVGD